VQISLSGNVVLFYIVMDNPSINRGVASKVPLLLFTGKNE